MKAFFTAALTAVAVSLTVVTVPAGQADTSAAQMARAPVGTALEAVPVAYAGTVYLTFDDGPHPTWTPKVVSILRKYGVRAVFFELGQNISWYPSVTRSVRANGNLIGNHTWNHPNLTYLSNYWVNWQLNKMEGALGYRPRCVRPPYGATSSRVASIIASRGQRQILWTVDPRDWSRPGTWSIVSRVLANVRGGSRILLHDGGGDRSQTVAALDLLIPRLRARGFVVGLMAC
ncbi:polysaccharide deacetylase family protein [Terrabacter sp. MAHUQ-38]|uniref:polysaccharide deacetylase family protein n=1 Tax=unclassified Terrabacter TaxID=2630222 RepID=UPI00165E07DB|nr:polysaccharide deacetylase family protein [Terrabacter sp. MAHUQ-38]MBC9821184.1 polysaccharide deacetylase family protein [Terrabacter sp. MAHUQ-38]